MGFTKWYLTYSYGSVGSLSKSLAKTYMIFKRRNPSASKHELLQLTLENYIAARDVTGGSRYNAEVTKGILETATGLQDIIFYVLRIDNPRGFEHMMRYSDVYYMVLEIIDERLSKYAPELR